MRDTLVVSEIFGPTFQGEGRSAGRVASFLRLGLCNLDCSWCDTPFTWDWTGKNGPPQDRAALLHLSIAQIAADLRRRGAPLTVVTGGEPMLQQRRLVDLFRELGGEAEIETNGTITPDVRLMPYRFNVSPKLASSGVKPGSAQTAMRNFAPLTDATFKFVIADTDRDFDEIAALVHDVRLPPARVWVMPEGRRQADLVSATVTAMADRALAAGYNFTTRLHVLLWGDERGR